MITERKYASQIISLHVCVIGGPTLWRMGMQALLDRQPHLAHVTQAAAAEAAAATEASPDGPDVYVLDGRSLALLPSLLKLKPLVPLLIVTDTLAETAVHSWLEQGVHGCIGRDATLPELLDAIRQIAAGEISLPPELTIRLIAGMAKTSTAVPDNGLGGLSRREQEVLTLLAEGFSNKQIAQHLYLSVRTVGNHLSSVYGKLNVHTRTEAALMAVQNNLPHRRG